MRTFYFQLRKHKRRKDYDFQQVLLLLLFCQGLPAFGKERLIAINRNEERRTVRIRYAVRHQ